MRIAVMSDTHWRTWDPSDLITSRLIDLLEVGYDAIWHAGDLEDNSVLKALENFCPVVCVKGNCDTFIGRHLPHSVMESVEGLRLGMIHGWDLALDHAPGICSRFADDVDIIIHGHTHRRRFQEFSRPSKSKVTIINPGSVSSPRGGETPGLGELLITGEDWEYRSLNL